MRVVIMGAIVLPAFAEYLSLNALYIDRTTNANHAGATDSTDHTDATLEPRSV